MEISVLKEHKSFAVPGNMTPQLISNTQLNFTVNNKKDVDAVKELTTQSDEKTHKEPVDMQDLSQMTDAMNEFVHAMNANIRFSIHQETNQIMVQVVDQSNDKILKEFPSHEFLDTIAAIRSYVGILLDKKI